MRYWIRKRELTAQIEQQQLNLSADPSLDGEEKLTELKLSLAMNARHLSKCGNPPRTLTNGYNRAEARGKKATHRLG